MARPCSICTHVQREQIDAALVAGEPLRDIAGRFGTSKSTLHRHKIQHLSRVVAQAEEATRADGVEVVRRHEADTIRHAIDVVQQLKAINQASLQILKAAREGNDDNLALKAVDRVQRQIELQAKLIGELDERPQVNVLLSPQWVTVRATLLAALAPFPEARRSVAAALLEVDGGSGG